MSPRLKIALAVVAGMIGGMLLLGTALAVPAALHEFGGGRPAIAERGYGPGMMGRDGAGQRGQFDGRGTCPRFDGEGRGSRGYAPRDGRGPDTGTSR